MFGGKKIWVTWCLHDVCWLHSFLFFYLRSKSLHRFLCFYLLKINLAHINYIILRHDLFDYSQECQNCHKTTTIAHITASTPKTFFFSSLKMREYHSVKLISSVENSSCEGENLWSGRTSSFTLPEHLSTKNLTKNKYTNDSRQKLNVRVTLRKEMMDYKGYKGHFDNSIIYSCAGTFSLA